MNREVTVMKKKAFVIFNVIAVIVLMWIFVSFVQVVSRNLDDATYSWWNAFQILVNLTKN